MGKCYGCHKEKETESAETTVYDEDEGLPVQAVVNLCQGCINEWKRRKIPVIFHGRRRR